MAASGPLAWPSKKLLVGKPVNTSDASNGFVSPAEIRRQIIVPLCGLFGGGFGGLIGWQFSTETPNHRDWNSEMPEALKPGVCQQEIRR